MNKAAMNRWKRFERETAKAFGVARKLMKGTDEKSDIDHPIFCVDCKLRKTWSVARWFRDIRKAARKANKIGILVLREPNSTTKLVVCELHVFISLCVGAGWVAKAQLATEAKELREAAEQLSDPYDGCYQWQQVLPKKRGGERR